MSHPQYIAHLIDTGDKYANLVKRAEILDYLSRPQDLPANLLELYQKALASLEENK